MNKVTHNIRLVKDYFQKYHGKLTLLVLIKLPDISVRQCFLKKLHTVTVKCYPETCTGI